MIARLPGDEAATKADVEALRADVALRTDLERFATKADLVAVEERLEERFDLKIENCENRLRAALADGLVAQTRTFVMSTIGALVTVGGLAVTAARL